ncbi:hypothetical protein A6E15_19405 [Natrinema saccharevitans]|uniref:Cdc6 C-terminal domain-containing protein n=1 Tax=Natrinema saccharevitans TaxID=301967 RepID=A0A1S8AR47_9EURY|nr:hypothetical protein [Natrinema saccharevitans]OLZ39132.1 hypothetical protein A6E15_19405 [Natrinema saccharevitans]
MKDLTSHGHLTLLAVVASTVADPDSVPLQKQTLCEQYQDLAQATDRGPLGGRTFHNHLAELSMLGILDRTKQNEGRAGGIYYEYEVDVPLDAALSTLENLHMSDELDLDSLRENARENGLL